MRVPRGRFRLPKARCWLANGFVQVSRCAPGKWCPRDSYRSSANRGGVPVRGDGELVANYRMMDRSVLRDTTTRIQSEMGNITYKDTAAGFSSPVLVPITRCATTLSKTTTSDDPESVAVFPTMHQTPMPFCYPARDVRASE